MKTIFTVLMLFLTFNSFCQELSGIKLINKPSYSENSELKVFYSDKSSEFHSDQKKAGIFVNDKFVGSQEVLNFINQDTIETIKIEKEKFEMNGTEYYGKIYIKMKSDYNPKFLKLKKLSEKYLELNENPIIYGDGKQKRCFSFVKDCISPLYKMMISAEANKQIIN